MIMQKKVSKSDRLAILKYIISNQQMRSQDDVIKAMAKQGCIVTQTTLSRDMKHLKVAKAMSPKGGYCYVMPDEGMYKRVHRLTMATIDPMLASGFDSIQFSGNMAVLHCCPGYASGIALHLDKADLPEVLGTIAGDDTVFIVLRQGVPLNEILDSLETVIPDVNLKLKD